MNRSHKKSRTVCHCCDCGYTEVNINQNWRVIDTGENFPIHNIPNTDFPCTYKGAMIMKSYKEMGETQNFVFYSLFIWKNEN